MTVTLDLPIPFSVNMVRRIDWSAHGKRKKWIALADSLVMARRQHRQNAIIGPFEVHITVSQNTRTDLDNCVKVILDYCVRLKLVTDDSPDYFRKLVVEFGPVEGSRVVIKPFEEEIPFITGTRRRKIVEHLWNHKEGVSTQDLVRAVYADCEDGGSDHRSVAVMVHHANKQLAPHLLRITATGGPGSVYRLEPIQRVSD